MRRWFRSRAGVRARSQQGGHVEVRASQTEGLQIVAEASRDMLTASLGCVLLPRHDTLESAF